MFNEILKKFNKTSIIVGVMYVYCHFVFFEVKKKQGHKNARMRTMDQNFGIVGL